jgi:hypothetical protein
MAYPKAKLENSGDKIFPCSRPLNKSPIISSAYGFNLEKRILG